MVYLLKLLPTYILHYTYGFSLGYPSILIPQLKAENISSLCLDSTSEGLVVGLDYATTFLISLITGQAQSSLGPLRMSQCACLPIFLAWILMASANNLSTVCMSRILVGLGNGIVLSSVYSVEVAEPEKRGAVIMVELIFRCLGLISISVTGTLLHWKTISTLILPLPVLSFFYGFCLPESPIYQAHNLMTRSLILWSAKYRCQIPC